MSGVTPEQRNPYKGLPQRAWVRLQLVALDGTAQELELVADTGSPFEIILGISVFRQFRRRKTRRVNTNFGVLLGGWVRVVINDIGLDVRVRGYGSDRVEARMQRNSPDFSGLVGLPFLRRLEYGGDADEFWILPAGGNP